MYVRLYGLAEQVYAGYGDYRVKPAPVGRQIPISASSHVDGRLRRLKAGCLAQVCNFVVLVAWTVAITLAPGE